MHKCFNSPVIRGLTVWVRTDSDALQEAAGFSATSQNLRRAEYLIVAQERRKKAGILMRKELSRMPVQMILLPDP